MNKENTIVPKLRFPEFVNEGEWETRELGMIADNLDFKRIPITGSVREKGDIPYYGASGIIDYVKDYIFDDELLCISEDGANLVDRTYPIAFTIKGKTWVNNHAHVLKFENKNTQILVETYLNTINLEKYITGATQPKLNQAKLAIITIPLSNIPAEQQKIASCLSSLDELIAAHTDKLEVLIDHKKGLMQQLFPAEGETVPKLRFKEFEKDGEWVEKELGKLGQFKGGGTPDRSNNDYWIGHIPWISSSDVADDDIHTISITRFINENAIKESATKIIPKGSVLFVSRVGVGKLAINKEEICTSQDFTSFIPNSILNYFIGYYFSANKQLLQSLNQGTSIKGFSKIDLERFKLPYPKNPQEQQKIASCLTSIDDLISAQEEKVDHLKEHKKGLMQGLFPVINE